MATRHQPEADLATVLAGLVAASAVAARYSGRRLGRTGRIARRRAWRIAGVSSARAMVAYHALRGDLPARRVRRPVEYIAATVSAGAVGAAAALGVRQVMNQHGTGDGPVAPLPTRESSPSSGAEVHSLRPT